MRRDQRSGIGREPLGEPGEPGAGPKQRIHAVPPDDRRRAQPAGIADPEHQDTGVDLESVPVLGQAELRRHAEHAVDPVARAVDLRPVDAAVALLDADPGLDHQRVRQDNDLVVDQSGTLNLGIAADRRQALAVGYDQHRPGQRLAAGGALRHLADHLVAIGLASADHALDRQQHDSKAEREPGEDDHLEHQVHAHLLSPRMAPGGARVTVFGDALDLLKAANRSPSRISYAWRRFLLYPNRAECDN